MAFESRAVLAFAKPHRVFGSITFCWWCSPGWWLLGCGFTAFRLVGCRASCSHLSTSWKPPQGQTPLRIQNNFPCAHRAKCWGGVGCWGLRSVGAQLTPVCWGHSRAGLVALTHLRIWGSAAPVRSKTTAQRLCAVGLRCAGWGRSLTVQHHPLGAPAAAARITGHHHLLGLQH